MNEPVRCETAGHGKPTLTEQSIRKETDDTKSLIRRMLHVAKNFTRYPVRSQCACAETKPRTRRDFTLLGIMRLGVGLSRLKRGEVLRLRRISGEDPAIGRGAPLSLLVDGFRENSTRKADRSPSHETEPPAPHTLLYFADVRTCQEITAIIG